MRVGRGFGKLAWKGVKSEVWAFAAFAMLMLHLVFCLSFRMVVGLRCPSFEGFWEGQKISEGLRPCTLQTRNSAQPSTGRGLRRGLPGSGFPNRAHLKISNKAFQARTSQAPRQAAGPPRQGLQAGAFQAGPPGRASEKIDGPEPGLGASGPGNTTTAGGEAFLGEARETSQKEVAMFCQKVWGISF